MKKLLMVIPLVFLLCFTFSCKKQEQVERYMEDGVEVIVNHLEPYRIRGKPNSLHLEEEFTIDTEKDEIAETGLFEIGGFDIDSEGKIYIFPDIGSDENLVYKFDQDGNFIKAFGRRGQGPREVDHCGYVYITDKDEIPILCEYPHKLVIYDKEGTYLQEMPLKVESNFSGVQLYPISNGKYLKHGGLFDPSTMHDYEVLQLFNSDLVKIKELDRCDYGISYYRSQKKTKLTPKVFIWRLSNEKIFVGHEKRGYEILIYDLDGILLKKIRKDYTPADVPNGFKKRVSNVMKRLKNIVALPDDMPPFHYFFPDDEGRLYVKTFEKGLNDNEYVHDVFNSDGIFILRKSMPGYARWRHPGNSVNRAKVKNNRFFCIREKESGFKELVVYRMIWE